MFWKKYNSLCVERGESANAVAKKLNIASGTVTEWKNGRKPRNSTLLKIADYFGVSVEYFNIGTDEVSLISDTLDLSALEPDKAELIRKVLSLSPDKVKAINAILRDE